MKKLIFISAAVLSVITGIFYACKKEQLSQSVKQEAAIMQTGSENNIRAADEQVRFNEKIKILSKGLIDIAKDKAIVSTLLYEASQSNDFEVHLEDIITSCDNHHKPKVIDPWYFKERMNQSIRRWENDNSNRDWVTELINSLIWEGKKYPPMLYVINLSTSDLSLEPIIAVGMSVNENDDYPAWKIDSSTNTLNEFVITEEIENNSKRPIIIVTPGDPGSPCSCCPHIIHPPNPHGIIDPFLCGNCECEAQNGENQSTCFKDCAKVKDASLCGNGICEPKNGESTCSCSQDCADSGGGGGGVPCTNYGWGGSIANCKGTVHSTNHDNYQCGPYPYIRIRFNEIMINNLYEATLQGKADIRYSAHGYNSKSMFWLTANDPDGIKITKLSKNDLHKWVNINFEFMRRKDNGLGKMEYNWCKDDPGLFLVIFEHDRFAGKKTLKCPDCYDDGAADGQCVLSYRATFEGEWYIRTCGSGLCYNDFAYQGSTKELCPFEGGLKIVRYE